MIKDWSEFINFVYKGDEDFQRKVRNEIPALLGLSGQTQIGENCGVQIVSKEDQTFIVTIQFEVNGDPDSAFPMSFSDRKSMLVKYIRADDKLILLKYLDENDVSYQKVRVFECGKDEAKYVREE